MQASSGAGAPSETVNGADCGFNSRKYNIYLFIFPFRRSSIEAKRGVELRHSTHAMPSEFVSLYNLCTKKFTPESCFVKV